MYGIALQADGKVMVGGAFTLVNNQNRPYITRLSNNTAAVQTLTVAADGTSITWTRSGSTVEVLRTKFEYSTDGINWIPLGNGVRSGTNWQLTGTSLPVGTSFFIRVRGFASGSGLYNGSTNTVELTQNFLL
ncbi:MAG: delta-60 repeat domain-containing protein [Acidobacteria bacterium]|nr:delta-60 repeat domain-containing protein [Acidobacteriota bacterium]